jgi:anti-sigma-K factor RskA
MKCAEVHINLGAFVMGGLETEEDAEIRRHLVSCSSCRDELQEIEKINQALEAAPPPTDPPDYLKDKILSRVREESSSSNRANEELPSSKALLRLALPVVAAGALIAMIALGVFFGLQTKAPVATVQLDPTPELREELRAEGEEYWGVAELHPQPSGSQLVELKLNNLEAPGPQSFYELWFSSGEEYVSAGAFTTSGLGETKVWLTAPPKARNYRTLLITRESVAVAPAPSKEEILRGETQ